jgi:hypothetical protein
VRTRFAPSLLIVTLVVIAVDQFHDGRPKKSILAQSLAEGIARGPGAYFPISYGTKYVTQVRLGIQRYLVAPDCYRLALAGEPAVYLAVEDVDAVLQEAQAAGLQAHALLRTRGGWGVVANRPSWQGTADRRLVMGPLDVTVLQADWRELRGRRLVLDALPGREPSVVIVNDGPHRENFSVSVGSSATVGWMVPPHTMQRAQWRDGAWVTTIERRTTTQRP